MIIGFMVENPKMSVTKMAIFYYLSGILANLFSVCVQAEVSVGPFPSIMAMVSGLIASVIVNWKALAGAGMMRICLIFMMVLLFVIILILSADNYVDWPSFYGISMTAEAGGFMSGLCLGLLLMPHALPRQSPYVNMIRKIGIALTGLYLVIMVPVFLFAIDARATKYAL